MIEKLFWLSFFTMWWLLLLSAVEPDLTSVGSFLIFGCAAALMTADRHVQEIKEKGK